MPVSKTVVPSSSLGGCAKTKYMKTLWVFGDSFSQDFENNKIKNFEDYRNFKGYYPKSWGKLVSEEFGWEYKNYAFGGWDNHSILQSFCEHITEIKPNDIIFIGWAPEVRIRLMDESGVWKSFTGQVHPEDWCGISSEIISKILLNRVKEPDYKPKEGVVKELLSWENMIKHTMKHMNLNIWKWYQNDLYLKHQSIQEETNGLIIDGHWSENGHKNYSIDLIKSLNLSNKLI